MLLIGLFTRFAAAITCLEMLAAYVVESVPRGPWPIHNGGNETLMYLAIFLFIAAIEAGAISLDS